jgi:hypothetical protein
VPKADSASFFRLLTIDVGYCTLISGEGQRKEDVIFVEEDASKNVSVYFQQYRYFPNSKIPVYYKNVKMRYGTGSFNNMNVS